MMPAVACQWLTLSQHSMKHELCDLCLRQSWIGNESELRVRTELWSLLYVVYHQGLNIFIIHSPTVASRFFLTVSETFLGGITFWIIVHLYYNGWHCFVRTWEQDYTCVLCNQDAWPFYPVHVSLRGRNIQLCGPTRISGAEPRGLSQSGSKRHPQRKTPVYTCVPGSYSRHEASAVSQVCVLVWVKG